MTEGQARESELSPEWQELIKGGIEMSLENYELFFKPSKPEDPFTPLSFSPMTLTEGVDERKYQELSTAEKNYIKQEFFQQLGIGDKPEIVETYETQAPEGQNWEGIARVNVYKTGRSEEGMFLHEINRSDDTQEYMVASQDYRL